MLPDLPDYIVNVTGQFMIIIEVCPIGFLGVVVPFTGKYAVTAVCLKTLAEAADTGKQVNESEIGVFRGGFPNMLISALVRFAWSLLANTASRKVGTLSLWK